MAIKSQDLKAFKQQLHNATLRLGGLNEVLAPIAVGMVQDNMRRGSYTQNAPLTRELKNGGSRPLINTGETRASITHKLRGDGFVIGTNKKHARLINDGGVVTAKKARKLILPATKDVKKRVDAWGVRKVLEWLEDSGWTLFWRPGALIGKAPNKVKKFGLPITVRTKGKKAQSRHQFFVIFWRKKSITVPKRRFMMLNDQQQATLLKVAGRHLRGKNESD